MPAFSDLGTDPKGGRRLFWGVLVRGVTKFASAFTKKGGGKELLNTVEDVCYLGSMLFYDTIIFGGG